MKQEIFSEGLSFQEGDEHESIGKLRTFLERLGYLEPTPVLGISESLTFDAGVRTAVEKYQQFHGLEATGVIDEPTRLMMERPRCGVPDLEGGQETHPPGVAMFVASGGAWASNNLFYKFANATGDLTGDRQQEILRQAFTAWSDVTPLQFTEAIGLTPAEFLISWVIGDHGDGFPFDGPGHVLAHAFFPPPVNPSPGIAGDVHFDDAETWMEGSTGGIDLLSVAIHELGHALGLRHSTDPNAIMFPTYSGPRHDLGEDDIAGIQSIYGKQAESPTGGLNWWQRFLRWLRELFE
jgi:hypothetical protein